MSLVNVVKVKSHYTRSINLERDVNSASVLQAYIPTSRAIRTLERVAETFGDKPAPRAWSLIGPYGSGKSAFSIFISHLFSDPELETTEQALKNLRVSEEPALAKKNKEAYRKLCRVSSRINHRLTRAIKSTHHQSIQ